MPLDWNTLKKLAKYDTPTICNLIELFDVRRRDEGYVDGTISAAFAELPPMVGYAVTATFRASSSALNSSTYETLDEQYHRLQSLSGPGVLVFQDLDVPSVGATFGEVMCTTYQALGATGLITTGAGRDLAQIELLQFPVFTGSTICSHAYSQIVDLHCLVRVGGLNVRPGDLLHGDVNGVTSIPEAIATEVVDVADDFLKAEAIVLDYASSSSDPKPQELVERRKAMGEAIGALRRQVSRSSRN